jgi:hypothetical protein
MNRYTAFTNNKTIQIIRDNDPDDGHPKWRIRTSLAGRMREAVRTVIWFAGGHTAITATNDKNVKVI